MLVAIAALNLACAVLLGAFGAHGLRAMTTPEQMAWWHTGTQYFFFHALGLLIIGFASRFAPSFNLVPSFWLLQAGIVIFCGSLFLMTLGAPRWFGAITPVGGLLMIAGWLMLAWSAYRHPLS